MSFPQPTPTRLSPIPKDTAAWRKTIAPIFLALALAGCGDRSSPEEAISEPPPSSFPEAPADVQEDGRDRATRTPLPDDAQIYQDDEGMFALAFPADYTYEAIAAGVTFQSADGGFGGIIQYSTLSPDETPGTSDQETASANSDNPDSSSPTPSPEALEQALKDQLESQFSEITWQSELQPQSDGSFRLDWTGNNATGADLDALSFIEQHGSVIFTLSAYGIDQPYSEYTRDAQIIVGTYVVRETLPDSASEPDPSEPSAADPSSDSE